ncbi:hypothetical protein [Chitiniphilus shinanonensis]|uniref:hypothetical protein n=1 Tax=Chitiniphilus shinanonensis TaxID=553088 RepID=UPI003060C697
MAQQSWREAALETMQEVLFIARQAAGDTPTQIAKAIDRAYPFGERAQWPYKA